MRTDAIITLQRTWGKKHEEKLIFCLISWKYPLASRDANWTLSSLVLALCHTSLLMTTLKTVGNGDPSPIPEFSFTQDQHELSKRMTVRVNTMIDNHCQFQNILWEILNRDGCLDPFVRKVTSHLDIVSMHDKHALIKKTKPFCHFLSLGKAGPFPKLPTLTNNTT